MREIRTSGSEGGAESSSVPTPYHADRSAAVPAAVPPASRRLLPPGYLSQPFAV